MSSLCAERLANNLSAPVVCEASMSTTGLVFLGPAMKIRVTRICCNQQGGCLFCVCVGGVCLGWEGSLAGSGAGKEGERIQARVGGIPGSL